MYLFFCHICQIWQKCSSWKTGQFFPQCKWILWNLQILLNLFGKKVYYGSIRTSHVSPRRPVCYLCDKKTQGIDKIFKLILHTSVIQAIQMRPHSPQKIKWNFPEAFIINLANWHGLTWGCFSVAVKGNMRSVLLLWTATVTSGWAHNLVYRPNLLANVIFHYGPELWLPFLQGFFP